MRFRLWQAPLVLALYSGAAPRTEAGHTRAGYVDGCQSADGRFVVTVELKTAPKGQDGAGVWQYTWLQFGHGFSTVEDQGQDGAGVC
jgi:hypothetical protein